MQREAYDAVTDEYRLPVLISAEASDRDGFATFFRELRSPTPVRVFRVSDLKDAHEHLTPEEAQYFIAVIGLTTALQNPSDSIALRKVQGNSSGTWLLNSAGQIERNRTGYGG